MVECASCYVQIQRWGRGPGPSLENHKLLYVSLEILVQPPHEKQFDPSVDTLTAFSGLLHA